MDIPTDPEGLFSTLNSFSNIFAGIIFSLIMKQYKSNKKELLIYWSLITLSLLFSGYFL